jgi:hypothetical protein
MFPSSPTTTTTISKRQKKRNLEELSDDLVITSVSVVRKQKCSYGNLLTDNTLLLVKVKEEKLEENIADKEGDFHTRKRCIDEQNDWFRARNPLKVSMLAILPHHGLLYNV